LAETELCIAVAHEADIVTARQKGREVAAGVGFAGTEQTLIATAISEVARNMLTYATRGEIVLAPIEEGRRHGILVIARDQGPGIDNLDLAMRDGYSTTKSLGMGLPGAKRLMHEFDIVSARGQGTVITMKRWRP
jgi:serine/threonine-protein kinase RsbT